MHFLAEYWAVVTDPAHLMAEGTWELLTFAAAYGVAKATGAVGRFRRSVHEEIDREHGMEHADGR